MDNDIEKAANRQTQNDREEYSKRRMYKQAHGASSLIAALPVTPGTRGKVAPGIFWRPV